MTGICKCDKHRDRLVLPPPDPSLIDTLGEGADPDRPVRIEAAAGPRDDDISEARLRGDTMEAVCREWYYRGIREGEAIAAAGPRDEGLREALLRLRDYGYQPMYNGRPSCPFCSRFVDDEETHAPGCVLVVALAEASE